jgi:pyridoxamine 5'-phosphate oxidase
MHQFRLTGNVTLVPEPGKGFFGSGGDLGFERFSARGCDWEAKHVQVLDGLSGRMRACWYHPMPGSPIKGGYEEAEKWPGAILATTGATNTNEKKLVDVAVEN